jgi:hypothetical protein
MLNLLKIAGAKTAELTLKDMLTRIVACHDAPFQIAEWREFRRLMTSLKNDINLIGADAVRNNVPQLFQKEKAKIASQLALVGSKFSFTLDIWSGLANKDFLAITIHYIDQEWKLRHYLLDFKPVTGNHTGLKIFCTFRDVLREWGLQQKVASITLDNASSNGAFIKELVEDPEINFEAQRHIRCFAHVINLACQESLKLLEEQLDAVRQVVKYIHSSSQRTTKYLELCELRELKTNMPKKDVPTRWNATFDMMDYAMNYSVAFDDMIEWANEEERAYDLSTITATHWSELNLIHEFLGVFKAATTECEAANYPTASIILPLYLFLVRECEKTKEKGSLLSRGIESVLHRAAHVALHKLKKYGDISPILKAATILDPRLNLAYFERLGEQNIEQIKADFRQKFELYKLAPSEHDGQATASVSGSTTYNSSTLFARIIQGNSNTTQNRSGDEIERYFRQESIVPESIPDLLTWWRLNAPAYPALSAMAKDYLQVVGSSAPSERIFSAAKRTLTESRCSLELDTIRMLSCLKSWINYQDSLD